MSEIAAQPGDVIDFSQAELEIEADDEDEARAAADATVESELGTECQLDWEITEVA